MLQRGDSPSQPIPRCLLPNRSRRRRVDFAPSHPFARLHQHLHLGSVLEPEFHERGADHRSLLVRRRGSVGLLEVLERDRKRKLLVGHVILEPLDSLVRHLVHVCLPSDPLRVRVL